MDRWVLKSVICSPYYTEVYILGKEGSCTQLLYIVVICFVENGEKELLLALGKFLGEDRHIQLSLCF